MVKTTYAIYINRPICPIFVCHKVVNKYTTKYTINAIVLLKDPSFLKNFYIDQKILSLIFNK